MKQGSPWSFSSITGVLAIPRQSDILLNCKHYKPVIGITANAMLKGCASGYSTKMFPLRLSTVCWPKILAPCLSSMMNRTFC
ncbi:Uncharacterised protein [Vibrio cholerae]|nr:Uncharacterised protein [Vibrio cholerae]